MTAAGLLAELPVGKGLFPIGRGPVFPFHLLESCAFECRCFAFARAFRELKKTEREVLHSSSVEHTLSADYLCLVSRAEGYQQKAHPNFDLIDVDRHGISSAGIFAISKRRY
jgi:hypothetical protein